MCIQMQPYVRRVNCNKEHTCQQQLGSLRVWAQRVGSGAPVLASVRRSELQDVEARSIPGHPAETRGKHFYFLPDSSQQGEHGFLIFLYFFQSGAAKTGEESPLRDWWIILDTEELCWAVDEEIITQTQRNTQNKLQVLFYCSQKKPVAL